MPKDDQAPATKKDVKMLMGHIGRLYDANERWKNEIIHTVDGKIEDSEERTKRYFDVVVEDIRHDLEGANKDEIEVIKDRVTRLEKHTKIAAA